MDNHEYSVPISYYDLREAETYNQIFDTLEHMGTVVDDIFSRISDRVSDESARLDSVSQRLGNALAKIALLSTSRKATTVFSPARYPATKETMTPGSEKLIFSKSMLLKSEEIVKKEKRYGIMADVSHKHSAPSFDADHLKLTIENFQMFQDCKEREQRKISPNEGLGKLPHLSSVSSFILFNTGETPYQKYDTYDNLAYWWLGKASDTTDAERARKEEDEKKAKKQLEEAPETIEQGEEMLEYHKYDVGYRPILENLPDMNLPANLPQLQNIADIEWQSNINPIAPSLNLEPLPDADLLPNNQTTFIPASVIAPTSRIVNNAIYDAYGRNGPAPPTSLPEVTIEAAPYTNYSNAPIAPPLPYVDNSSVPVPPPMMANPVEVSSTKSPLPSGGGGDGRSSLLDEIRKGKQLKRVSDEGVPPEEEQTSSAKPAAPGGEDMFAQLFKAVQRRRKVIQEESDDERKIKKKKRNDGSDEEWE